MALRTARRTVLMGLALDQGNQAATMGFTDHGVAFPVTDTPPGIDHGRTLSHRDPLRNNPAPVIGDITFALGFWQRRPRYRSPSESLSP